jgi:hypothetical protein
MSGCRCCPGKLRRGLVGLTTAAARLDPVPVDQLRRRHALCLGAGGRPACERLVLGSVCSACHCLVAAKVRVASERCPLGKWGPATGIMTPPGV